VLLEFDMPYFIQHNAGRMAFGPMVSCIGCRRWRATATTWMLPRKNGKVVKGQSAGRQRPAQGTLLG
jgi:hypothetical protein